MKPLDALKEEGRRTARMELLLKRSQVALPQLEEILGKFYLIKRTSRGRREVLQGTLRSGKGLYGIGEGPMLFMDIPYADRERKDRATRFFSRFSSSLYRLKLVNVDLPTLLDLLGELHKIGVDVGLVEDSRLGGRSSLVGRGERFRWPKDRQARLALATELHSLYARQVVKGPLIDLDFYILSLRSIARRKLRTAFLVVVMSLVCANFIQHISFTISREGIAMIVTEQWELPVAAGLLALITFLNLNQISLYERMVEIGTIRALGAETTTTLLIFAAEGITIGTIGAILGYMIVLIANLIIKFGGIDPGLDLVAACGPIKAILGIFLGITVGLIGSLLPIVPVIWRSPEKCLEGPK